MPASEDAQEEELIREFITAFLDLAAMQQTNAQQDLENELNELRAKLEGHTHPETTPAAPRD